MNARRRCWPGAALVIGALLGCFGGLPAFAAEQVKGRVLKPDGQPAAGAKVCLYYVHDMTGYGSRKLSETQADAEGSFAFELPTVEPPAIAVGLPMMCYVVMARLEGYAFGAMPVSAQVLEGYEIYLEEGRDIKCVVKDRTGRPVKGAVVRPIDSSFVGPFGSDSRLSGVMMKFEERIPISVFSADLPEALTDEDGVAVLKNVLGDSVTLVAEHEKLGTLGMFQAGPRDEAAAVMGTPGFGMVFRGNVTREDTGEPVEGALVTTGFFGPFVAGIAYTEKDGSFRLVCRSVFAMQQSIYVLDPSASPSYAATVVPGLGFGERGELLRRAPMERDAAGGAQMAIELNCKVTAGKLLRGKVVDTVTGKPARGAVVRIVAMRQRMDMERAPYVPPVMLCCLTDARGDYRCRIAENQINVSLATAPIGYAMASMATPKMLNMENEETVCDWEAAFVPETVLKLAVKTPDGQPARGARVDARFVGAYSQWAGKAGADGGLTAARVPGGADAPFCAFSAEKDFAATGTLSVPREPGAHKLQVDLKPARTAVVTFRDADDVALRGHVTVGLVVGERQTFWVETFTGGQAEEERKVRGLLPGETYVVSGHVPGFTPAQEGGTVRLRLEENQEEPKVVLKFVKAREDRRPDRVARPAPPAPVKPRTQAPARQDFEEALAGLKDAEWQKQDPVQAHLTWYGLDGGIALADAEAREVRYSPGLFGFDTMTVNAIAFGKEKVWLGTDKGLMAWDRAFASWSRLPGDGINLDAPVTAVAVDDQDMLHLTVQVEGKPARRLVYNPRTTQWTEAKE